MADTAGAVADSAAGPDVDVRVATSSADFADLLALRQRVFIDEQNVDVSEEFDAHDTEGCNMAAGHTLGSSTPDTLAAFVAAECVYVVARLGDTHVGTGRMITVADYRDGRPWGKVGRVAVEKSARGGGVGRAMMIKMEEVAREKGLGGVTLGTQVHARAFYERLGYTVLEGSEFIDAGIPHIKAEKAL